MNDLDIFKICVALYSTQPVGYWTHLFPIDGSYCAVKRVGNIDVVVWRGSTTALDWFQDFLATPAIDFQDVRLGPCHAGFLAGVRGVLPEVNAVLGPNVIITGHSLGAAHAFIHAGYLVTGAHTPDGKPLIPLKVVVAGSPRPGFGQLKGLLHNAGVPMSSYKNLQDPVTDVPVAYLEPAPFTALTDAPPSNDPWGIVADHHSELYLAGLTKLFPENSNAHP